MDEEIKNAIKIMQSGGIILYPTDTIWGIGCDATNPEAVKKVYELKQRTDSKAMLVLVDNPGRIQSYVDEMPDMAWQLIELSEKPLTVIYSGARNLAENLIAEDHTIGIRVTDEVFSKKLCERFRRPIVSTSANISGEKSPQRFADIDERILKGVDYVVNYRQKETSGSKPSSIIKLDKGNVVTIIRE